MLDFFSSSHHIVFVFLFVCYIIIFHHDHDFGSLFVTVFGTLYWSVVDVSPIVKQIKVNKHGETGFRNIQAFK